MAPSQVQCGLCGWQGEISKLRCDLQNVTDLFERIEPGGEIPYGECPDCGGLTYAVNKTIKGRCYCQEIANDCDAWLEGETDIETSELFKCIRQAARSCQNNKVVITVEGGIVQHIEKEPGIEITVRDYDIKGGDEEDMTRDPDGNLCFETIYEA